MTSGESRPPLSPIEATGGGLALETRESDAATPICKTTVGGPAMSREQALQSWPMPRSNFVHARHRSSPGAGCSARSLTCRASAGRRAVRRSGPTSAGAVTSVARSTSRMAGYA